MLFLKADILPSKEFKVQVASAILASSSSNFNSNNRFCTGKDELYNTHVRSHWHHILGDKIHS